MPGETKETTVTDAALDQAASAFQANAEPDPGQAKDGVVSETKTGEEVKQDASAIQKEAEAIKKEEKEPEETDQQFRSRLGRRVSKLEDTINSFIQEMRTLNLNRTVEKTPAQEEEYISTKADVRRVLTDLEREQRETLLKYETNYVSHVLRLGTEEGLTDKELERLEGLLQTSFNTTYSNHQDPQGDAERNYLKAMRVIEREKAGKEKKEVNLKHDNPIATGINQAAKQIDKSLPPIKLSKEAQEFVNYHKMTDESVRKAMAGQIPDRLNKSI